MLFWDEAYQIARFHVYVTAKHGEFPGEREGEGEGSKEYKVTPSRRSSSLQVVLMGKIKLKGMFELIDLSQPAARPVVILHWIPAVEPGRTQ